MKKSAIRPGYSYLLKEKKFDKSIKLFKKLVSEGNEGLCITKYKPARLSKNYGLNTRMFQLTDKKGASNINPKDTAKLMRRIEYFVTPIKRGVILFEGIDKVIENNNFISALNLLEDINDTIMESNSSLILALNKSKFNRKELAFLERNLESVHPLKLGK
ncbi:MAG: DUF835 domain-containing protein [Candidatus Thermoplasmatota archaeon]